jgi:hypothetical protein
MSLDIISYFIQKKEKQKLNNIKSLLGFFLLNKEYIDAIMKDDRIGGRI